MTPIDEITVKLDRAQEHLDTFDREVKVYLRRYPIALDSKLEPKGQNEFDLFVFYDILEHPPLRLSTIAGDVLYNMRSVLDHLVYQLSIPHATMYGIDLDIAGTEFPIFTDGQKFHQKVARGKTKGHPANGSGLYKIRLVPPKAQAIIKGLQPYHGGNLAPRHDFAVLQSLCNADKHRHFIVASPPIGRVGLIQLPDFTFKNVEIFAAHHPLKDRTIIYKARVVGNKGFNRHVKVHAQFPPHVAFKGISDVRQQYATEIMQAILFSIKQRVVAPLKPFLLW